MKIHEFYINRCLELAKNGIGNTYPNPSVGCVIVHGNSIIGEGFTSKAGGPHAEVNAINSVKDPSLLKEATIYVTLEPCSHYGKTPPCSDLIIEKGIPRAVIGTLDSNKEVSGRGIKKLAENGCDVVVGVLEEACRESNKRFFCFHELKRPYIILKWAQSSDGFIAPAPGSRANANAAPVWLSSIPSRQLVHKWRSEEQAIMVGTETVLSDNPGLTTRDWNGPDPVRIFTDRSGKVPPGSQLLDGSAPTLVFTEKTEAFENLTVPGLEIISRDPNQSLPEQLTSELYHRSIQSVIIEGGAHTLNSFIASGLWDEARVFTAPVRLGEGIEAPETGLPETDSIQVGPDRLSTFKNTAKKS